MRRVVRISLNRRISRTDIERQEVGIRAGQLRGHEHQVIVHDKVNQAGIQHPVAGIAVRLILDDAVLIALPGSFVFQFAGNDGNAVDKDTEVKLVISVCSVSGIPHLTNYRKTVFTV